MSTIQLAQIDSKFDNLFKSIISAGWNVTSDGNVEAPCGYFAVTEIPANPHEFAQMRDAVGEYEYAEYPEAGWYFSFENDQGIIYVYKCSSRQTAFKAFISAQLDFSKWDTEDDEPLPALEDDPQRGMAP